MYERFTDRARKVMQLANQEAQRFNHEYIGTEHILLGLVKEGSGVAANVLKALDLDTAKIRLEVEKIVQSGPDMVTMGKLPQTPRAKKVIEFAVEEARSLQHNYVGTEHLLLGLLREQEGVAAQVLMNFGLKLEDVREEVMNMLGHNNPGHDTGSNEPRSGNSKTPTLDSFSRDLTELARHGKLDPVVGRSEELYRMTRILCRRSKNSPVLVGEVGVGKTALVSGLAQRIAEGRVPELLRDRRILAVNLNLLLAGTSYRGQLEERMTGLVKELQKVGNVILFLDDLHLWAEYEAVLYPLAMGRADIRPCLTATTPAEYAKFLEKMSTVSRYFLPVVVRPPSREEAMAMLVGLRDRYEAHHRVMIHDDALRTALDMAAREEKTSSLIDRAIDLIDEAAADVRLRNVAPPPDLREIDSQIEVLNLEKEAAVADADFEKAAAARDRADKLKKQKEALTQEWRTKQSTVVSAVDAEAVTRIVVQ